MQEIILYQDSDGKVKLDVTLEDNNLWLSQEQIATLFGKARTTITEHISNIFSDTELEKEVVCRYYRHATKHGAIEDKTQSVDVMYYNLDLIIAVGYRVRSKQGIQFRKWATDILKDYITKGFAMDDLRLKEMGGGNYWKELLDRIRDIRSSEKVFYRQVLELYATSIDYNAKAEETIEFFKIVQNKLHFAVHGQTASELIYDRVNAEKEFLGLTIFKGELPTKAEAKIAKNYLSEKELKVLNNLVSGYFDFAEVYASKHEHLYMKDYIKHLDSILSANGDTVLQNAGTISHKAAMSKVAEEYAKYEIKTLTSIEKEYLESIKTLSLSVK